MSRILSLTEKIFYWHIANSNPELKKYLLSNVCNIYVESREYTQCGLYLYVSSFFNGDIVLPKHIYGEYISINKEFDADFIIYTDAKSITVMELVSVHFEFDEVKIASSLLDNVILSP